MKTVVVLFHDFKIIKIAKNWLLLKLHFFLQSLVVILDFDV